MTKQEMELVQEIVEIGKELISLRTENAQLKERVAYLEKQNLQLIQKPVPAVQPQVLPRDFYIDKPFTAPNTAPYNHCPKCGLKLEGVMGYLCSNPSCPTGLGSVMCNTAL